MDNQEVKPMTYLSKSMQDSRNRSNRKAIEKRKGQKPAYPSPSKNAPKRILKRLQPRKPLKRRNALHPLSKKRAAQNREYLKLRTQFLKDHPKCAVYPLFNSVEIHHKKGRTGKLLTDTRYWLAVCRSAHQWIEAHPEESYRFGWSLKRLAK